MIVPRTGAGLRLHWGALINFSLVLAWLISTIGLLSTGSAWMGPWQLTGALLLRTQLQTALFIVGHDAMHGLLWPGNRVWNDRLGALVLFLYAALPYRRCRHQHQQHHRAPGSLEDPDCPSSPAGGLLHWYAEFMGSYLSLSQMVQLLTTWAALSIAVGTINSRAPLQVLLFCTVPLLLSSLQLFLFGTFLPHRHQLAPRRFQHPESLDLPVWLSLLTCFHFGYHREHHDHPGLAWFELPRARRQTIRSRQAHSACSV